MLAFSPFNLLPDNKILDLPKLKAFADDKLNVTQNFKVVFHRIENIAGKEENAFPPVCQKSSLCGKGLRQYFLKVSFLCIVKSLICVTKAQRFYCSCMA